ncbi:hypothetical protein FGU71_06470 [Erythrobacter insulae]|uniref:Uncharacterized protein n=1 Tax=Erythrobacter insulae TaxID=2584124 RepID=A0A547PBN0_9SPHN|nr:hypothetical protein [Erythrobacter insulae]TRD11536.1 hypothetical protein FGU71_06470 [Erythrobacter insulae]
MKALFQNPKAALAYVGITLVSVALFVGTEDDPGTLHKTVETFGDGETAQDRAAGRKFGDLGPEQDTIGTPAKRSKPASPETEDVIMRFATDDELIDDAQGFDPTPEVFGGFDASGEKKDAYLSDQDKGDGEASFGGWAGSEKDGEDDE